MATTDAKNDQQKIKGFADANTSFSGCDMVAFIDLSLPDGSFVSAPLGMIQTITYSTHMDKAPVRVLGNINARDYVFGPRTIAGSLMFAVFDRHWAYRVLEDIGKKEEYSKLQFLVDELPPFNITISLANEAGVNGRIALYGVRLVSEGMVLSVNDVYTENTYQFVATGLDYLKNSTRLASNLKTVNTKVISQRDTKTNRNTKTVTPKTTENKTAPKQTPGYTIPPDAIDASQNPIPGQSGKGAEIGPILAEKTPAPSNGGTDMKKLQIDVTKTIRNAIRILRRGGVKL